MAKQAANADERPRYRVNQRSFINLGLVEEGAEVTYDGEPSENLEPLNAAAVAAIKAANAAHPDKYRDRIAKAGRGGKATTDGGDGDLA